VLGQVGMRARRHQVLETIISLLAPLDLVADLPGSVGCDSNPRGSLPSSA